MGTVRLFLALSVVIHHLPQRSFQWLNAGVAVIAFFMISGFYMALVINEKYRHLDHWRRRFYLGRLARIFPAYLFVLAFGVLWTLVLHQPGETVLLHYEQLEAWKKGTLVFMNVFIVGQDLFQTILMTPVKDGQNIVADSAYALFGADYFQNKFMVIGQAWSLGSELVFYALAPFLVTSWRRVFAVLLLSLGVRVAVLWNADAYPPSVWSYWFLPGTLSFFCLGCCSYFGYAWLAKLKPGPRAACVKAASLAISAMFLYWAGSQSFIGGLLYEGDHYDTHVHWTFYLGLAISLPFLFSVTKNWSYDRLIGELSYPLYLVHGFVIGIFLNLKGVSKGSFETEWIIIVLSVGVAALVYLFVDAPVERFRRRLEVMDFGPRQPGRPG